MQEAKITPVEWVTISVIYPNNTNKKVIKWYLKRYPNNSSNSIGKNDNGVLNNVELKLIMYEWLICN